MVNNDDDDDDDGVIAAVDGVEAGSLAGRVVVEPLLALIPSDCIVAVVAVDDDVERMFRSIKVGGVSSAAWISNRIVSKSDGKVLTAGD